MKSVWGHYQSKDSSFKVYQEPIKNFPTLTVCTGPGSNYSYDLDFTIHYQISTSYSEPDVKLKLGENEIKKEDNSTETVYLDNVSTFFSGTCYKIYIKLNYIIEIEISKIHIEFKDIITYDNLPDVLEFYLTSEKNFHGIFFNEWKDGEELAIKIPKVLINLAMYALYSCQF